jgi:hypothetical protein
MNTYREELKAKFIEAGLKKDDFYEHPQSKMHIIKHKGVEKLACHYGIWWKLDLIKPDLPNIVVKCWATNGTQEIESFGEANPLMTKSAVEKVFPYALAEKRAVDRAILKLLNAHGTLYSEAEANEYEVENEKQPARNKV